MTLCCWCDSPATGRLDDDPVCAEHAELYGHTYERFTLANDPPARKLAIDNNDTRQRVLFSGMDCLEGQTDLFPTDGGD